MSKIHWTDETINSVVGCSKISAGCQNCYAENMARRLAAMGKVQYQLVTAHGAWEGRTHFVPSELEKPYRWKKPRTIFIGSMGDLFHESVPFEWIDQVAALIGLYSQHTFILLTKRPQRMLEYFSSDRKRLVEEHQIPRRYDLGRRQGIFTSFPPPNIVVGVSVEDQETADERIPLLLKTSAAKRFISLEPMIGPVDLMNLKGPGNCRYQCLKPIVSDNDYRRPGLDGVILGGESGPKARPLDPAWVRMVRDQCAAASVPFMFKQWGEWVQWGGLDCDGVRHLNLDQMNAKYKQGPHCMYRVGKKLAGNLLDGRTHTELAWKTKKTP